MTRKDIIQHKEALRVWLRGKGFHPADIKFALTWYELRAGEGKNISDSDVLLKADAAHRAAVETIPTPEILVSVKPKSNGGSVFFGAAVATIFILQVEVILWLAFLLIPSLQ